MTALPEAPRRQPAVLDYLRENRRIRRFLDWTRRHRNLAAAVASLLLVLKAYRWLLPFLIAKLFSPADTARWIADRWEMIALVSSGGFLVLFIGIRSGIDFYDRWARIQDALDLEISDVDHAAPGPAWAERPADRAITIPPRMG